jgi:hypothetical protein
MLDWVGSIMTLTPATVWLLSHPQRLRLALGVEFARDSADDTRFEAELPKDSPYFLNAERGLVEFEINNVMIAINLVAQTRNRLELVIQLKDFLKCTYSSGIYLKFDHNYFVKTGILLLAE